MKLKTLKESKKLKTFSLVHQKRRNKILARFNNTPAHLWVPLNVEAHQTGNKMSLRYKPKIVHQKRIPWYWTGKRHRPHSLAAAKSLLNRWCLFWPKSTTMTSLAIIFRRHLIQKTNICEIMEITRQVHKFLNKAPLSKTLEAQQAAKGLRMRWSRIVVLVRSRRRPRRLQRRVIRQFKILMMM